MIEACAGALRLRRSAIRLLATDAATVREELRVELASIPVTAWQIFLPEEGCAAVIGARLSKLGLLDTLAAEVQREITTSTLVETQRVLGVKAQLTAVARIATQCDWRDIVVLKGGVQVAENGDVMFIHDLDLLARGEVVEQLPKQLRAAGYEGGEEDNAHHLTPMTSGSGVPIEIHSRWDRDANAVTEDWWERTLPLATCPPLRQPSPADQLRHLLWHMVEHHAELRGRLRDMLLAARAWQQMRQSATRESGEHLPSAQGDLMELHAAIDQHPMRAALHATLRFAQTIGQRNTVDPFERRAAGRYVLRSLSRVTRVPDMLRGQLIALTLALVDRPTDMRIYARRVLPTIWQLSARTRTENPLRWAAMATVKVVRRVVAQGAVAAMAPVLAGAAARSLARSTQPPAHTSAPQK